MPRSRAVIEPNLGLYLDRPFVAIPPRGLRDCLNVRVKKGRLTNENMGWEKFPSALKHVILNGPVLLIDAFTPRATVSTQIFGSATDLYQYDPGNQVVKYLTQRYETGTVSINNGSPTLTGVGTTWTTNVKAGDAVYIGAAGRVDPTGTWMTVLTVDSNTQITLTANWAGSNQAAVAYTVRKLFTGTMQDFWMTVMFPAATSVGGAGGAGDRLYLNNGIDKPVAWDGSTDQVYVPNLGVDRCGAMERYKNLLVLGDVTISGDRRPSSIKWSDVGKPETMGSGSAGEAVAYDSSAPCNVLVTLGDALIIYAERAVVAGQFVGGDTKFVFRTAVDGIGAIAGRAVADFGDYHQFVGNDAQYRFDGVTLQEVGNHVFREVLRKHSPQRRAMMQAHFDDENGELLWIVPLNTDPDPSAGAPMLAYDEHYLETPTDDDERPVFIRELPATATGTFERATTLTWDQIVGTWEQQNYRWDDQFLQAAFPFNLFGGADGKIYIFNSTARKDGAAMTCFARFGRRPVIDGRFKGIIQRIYAFLETVEGALWTLRIRLFGADTVAGPTELIADLGYDPKQPQDKAFVSPRKAARFMEIEFRTEGLDEVWTLSGYDTQETPAGMR